MRATASVIVSFLVALFDVAAADQTKKLNSLKSYQRITTLNAFGLVRPIPPPSVALPTVPTKAPPDVRLSGIAASASGKRAFFVRNDRGKSVQYFSLAEGQRDDDIELLAIDLAAEIANVSCGSSEFKLSLKNDSPRANAPPLKFRMVTGHTR
jgi:type II secretory pathway component PulC